MQTVIKKYPTQTIKKNGARRAVVCVYLTDYEDPEPEDDSEEEAPNIADDIMNAGKALLTSAGATSAACCTCLFLKQKPGEIRIDVQDVQEEAAAENVLENVLDI